MGTRKKFNIELYLGIMATLIAFLSIVIAVWERIEYREHNRLTVKPILLFDKTINISKDEDGTLVSKEVILKLQNAGLGPAVIEEFDIFLNLPDGKIKRSKSWNEIFELWGFNGLVNKYADFRKNDVIVAGEETEIIVLNSVDEAFPKIDIKLRYNSIYDDEFTIVSKNN